MEPGGEIPARPDSPNPAQPGAALGGAHQGRAGDGSPAGVLGRGGAGPAGALRSTGPAGGWGHRPSRGLEGAEAQAGEEARPGKRRCWPIPGRTRARKDGGPAGEEEGSRGTGPKAQPARWRPSRDWSTGPARYPGLPCLYPGPALVTSAWRSLFRPGLR
jgi:hypothetical protein